MVQMIVGVCQNCMVYCHLVASMSDIFTCRMEENVHYGSVQTKHKIEHSVTTPLTFKLRHLSCGKWCRIILSKTSKIKYFTSAKCIYN